MNIVVNGQALASKKDTEGIANLFPGHDPIPDRPKVSPYGFHSMAPDDTLSVSARVGDHTGNRYVIGHRDSNRPDVATGEAVLYNGFGQQVRMQNGDIVLVRNAGKIHLGSAGSANPVNLGDLVQSVLSQFLQIFAVHTHEDSMGGMTMVPLNAGSATTLKGTPVDDGKINSDHVFTEK